MIDIEIAGRIIRQRIKLFYEKPKHLDALRLAEYSPTGSKEDIFGFKKKSVFTIVINLTETPDALLSHCKKNTKYEIRRAERDGVKFKIENNLDVFIDFYNSFAKSKDDSTDVLVRTINCVHQFKNNLAITKAVLENEILVLHSYMFDEEAKRVRLLLTASLFRNENDAQKRHLIGRANRFLHYQDMIYFKSEGFGIYDMGGYAYHTDDIVLKKINDFKNSFGGELIEESCYISFPLYIYRELRKYQEKVFKMSLQ